MTRKSIFVHSIKRSLLLLGAVPIYGRRRRDGNVPYHPPALSLSVSGEHRKQRVGYEGLLKKVSGYYGSELFLAMNRPYVYGDIPAVGSMTAHCQPNSVAQHCQGISLIEILVALTLLSISSLLLLQYLGSLQRSEQVHWQRQEVWQQLAQRLEGGEQAASTLESKQIPATNGCYWQRVTWQASTISPQSLQRLRCP